MDLFAFDPPQIDLAEISAIAADVYGIEGTPTRLRGERSHNTLITAPQGAAHVLKIASASEDVDTIGMHAAALVHLAHRDPSLPVARMVPGLDGTVVPLLDRDGCTHAMRLVTHLPGEPFGDDQPLTPESLRSIGVLVGRVSAALSTFDHPSASHFMAWDIANGLVLDDELWAGLGADAVAVLAPGRPLLSEALRAMSTLPRQVIHNDGHAGNLLRSDPASDLVTGIIDFGDLVHTVTVADLAVSAANLAPHQHDPVEALVALVDGFRSVRDVSLDELHALPNLVLCRIALSTLLVEHQIVHAPHIAEAVGRERPGLLAAIDRWLALDPNRIRERLIEAT